MQGTTPSIRLMKFSLELQQVQALEKMVICVLEAQLEELRMKHTGGDIRPDLVRPHRCQSLLHS